MHYVTVECMYLKLQVVWLNVFSYSSAFMMYVWIVFQLSKLGSEDVSLVFSESIFFTIYYLFVWKTDGHICIYFCSVDYYFGVVCSIYQWSTQCIVDMYFDLKRGEPRASCMLHRFSLSKISNWDCMLKSTYVRVSNSVTCVCIWEVNKLLILFRPE